MSFNYRIFVFSIIISLNLLISLSTQAQVFDFRKFLKTETEESEEPKTQVHSTSLETPGPTTKSGIRLSLPSSWKVVRDESDSLDAQGPNGMWLAIVMNDYGAGFPIEASLQAYKDSAIQEKGQGKLVSWSERVIDGVTGIQRVEAPMPEVEDPRRITWVGYKGTVGINMVASSRSKDFDSNYSALNEVLDSIAW